MSGRIGRTGTEPSAFRLQSFGMTKMFRFSRRGTALLVLILLMTGRMAAWTPHFARFFNVSLPYAANEVEQVWQDRQGMVWLITRQGVFTYDGYSTRKITGGSFWTAAALNRWAVTTDSGFSTSEPNGSAALWAMSRRRARYV